jgi:hypothetical protein
LVDSHAAQIGDVATILVDGAHWGTGPLGITGPNPAGWRILKMANVAWGDADNLLVGEHETNPQHPSPYLQYRQFFIDASKVIDPAVLAYLADDSRAAPFMVLDYGANWLDSVTSKRPRIYWT